MSQRLLTLDKRPKSGRAGFYASNKIPSAARDPAGQVDAGHKLARPRAGQMRGPGGSFPHTLGPEAIPKAMVLDGHSDH